MAFKSHIRTFLFDCFWLAVLAVSLPWLVWRALFKGKNRRGWTQKLFGLAPVASEESARKRIWLHAVSLGEVHVLKTLVDQLQREHVDCELFVSTTTETGYDRATSLFGNEHQVFFFPFDFSWAIRNVIRRIKPDLLVLAELELWPNLIHVANRNRLPVMVANGRLSENSHGNYKRFGWLTQPMFEKLSVVAAQDEAYASRFVDLGCRRDAVTVSGNLKYDSIETSRTNHKADLCRDIALEFGVEASDRVLVAGSTQIEDETAAVEAWFKARTKIPDLKLVVVPRHPERANEAVALLKERDVSVARRSELNACAADLWQKQKVDALVVDVIGELAGWWAIADVAFVGGSMGSRGGQNMIEPAAYGIPVCFGPNTVNFKSTVDGLLANKAARVVNNGDELAAFASEMLDADTTASEMGRRAQEFVLSHKGAAARTVQLICNVVAGVEPVRAERAA